jgi:hypothetical protein
MKLEEESNLLDQLLEQYSLYKDEMHPAQIICIQIGIEEYKAKLTTIAEGLVSLGTLVQEQS